MIASVILIIKLRRIMIMQSMTIKYISFNNLNKEVIQPKMEQQKSFRNPQKNNLIQRLYKSNNRSIMSSQKPINLPLLESFHRSDNKKQGEIKILVPKIIKERLKPLNNESLVKSKLSSHFDQSQIATDRQRSLLFMQQSRVMLKSPLPSLSTRRSHVYLSSHQSSLNMSTQLRYDTKKLEYQRIRSKIVQTQRLKMDQRVKNNKSSSSSIIVQKTSNSHLTPNDFMEILKIDREMSQEFCYMNKTNPYNPYDWKIVEFQNRNPQEYMVISKRGLTKYRMKEVEFIQFEQFLEQQRIYNRLIKIGYFKLYHQQKYFRIWKKFSSVSVFKLRSKMFQQATLLIDVYLNEMRIDIRRLVINMQSIQCFYTQTLSNMEIDDFKSYANNERSKTMGKIKQFEELILNNLKEKTARSMDVFMKKMRISKQTQRNSVDEKKVPLLIGDESGKQMPYTQSATLRTHQLKIRNFIKLTDYLILTSKIELILTMIRHLTDNIAQINSFFGENKQTFSNYAWINIKIYEQNDEIKFTPTQDEFIEQLEQVVYGTVGMICNQHRQYLHHQEFTDYWRCNIDAQMADEYIDIKSIVNINPRFNKNINDYRYQIKTSFTNLKLHSAIFDKSLQFIQYMRDINSMDLTKQNAQFFRNTLGNIKQELKGLNQIDNMKDIGIILLNSIAYKAKVEKLAEELSIKIYSIIPNILLERSEYLLNQIRRNYDLIGLNPMTIKDYIDFLKNTNQVNKFAQSTSPLINDNSYLLTLSQSYSIKISQNIRSVLGQANGQMIGLSRRLYEIEKGANQTNDKFKKQIQKLIPTFEERLKVQKQKLNEADLLKNNQKLQKKLELIAELAKNLSVLIKDKNELRKYQQELGMAVTQFEDIDSFEYQFKLLESLWQEKKNWMEFIEKNWIRIIGVLRFDEIRRYLQGLTKKLSTFQRQFQLNEVVTSFKFDVDNFRPLFFSIQSLTNQALKQKHFQLIRSLIRSNFFNRQFPSHSITIQQLFIDFQLSIYTFEFFQSIQLHKLKDEIIEIAIQAEKEAELIEMISQVEMIWKHTQIIVAPYKDGKDTILGNNDQLITKIDDNLLVVNNILASKYVAPLKQRVQTQAKMLRYMQDLIDEWYLHQRNWIYLEPILRSPFALKNLPKQSSMFTQIDNKWKIIMKMAKDSSNIKKYGDELNSNYTLKTLRTNNELFDIVQKALQNFLQKKRDLFQRFYFLSNDQLLEILSTVKSFEQIQPHLKKVFENFVSIKLDEKGIPLAMVSGEQEVVTLRNCIFRGEVQEWFRSAEESMKLTLRGLIRQGEQKFTQHGIKRTQWLRMFPSQIILIVDCLMWTRITEGYLQDSQQSDLTQWYNINVQQLNQLVELIRGDLTKLERKLIVALITQDVHYRDIVEGLVGCESVSDFKWIQQLRFYNSNQNVVARQVQAELTYGYEYLGATTRLVITPLTDRCWITITGALHIKLGANPAGPAGTGKTESCKDLAKSLGRYCIVFNCSDQITALMMEKLFTGLAFTGSWTCLDQFNRIDIEVLSVIAQQVLTIRQALLLGRNTKQFDFGGKRINLNHDLGIFITMNPGYAGRTQLPDNLKTLFRPVAMMVPDYTLIAQIMLFSQGFSSAKELSKKMTKLYKLSSEQLSQQDHYDFGMRAVKSVLVMAGGLKRESPNVAEDVILIRAMQDSNIPKFLSYDIPLFNSIIQDLFPNVVIPQRNQQDLINKLNKKCSQQNIVSTPKFIEKCLQFNQTLKVRFGVMLVGPPMGSKTKIANTLLDTFPCVINPKAVSLAQLYGNFDILTQTWSDGLAAKILRETVVTHEYIMFDGPVDAIWVQNLNTVLDDSQMLCLSNGQRIKLSPKSRVLFQVLDLNQASPATVSRCGMVWVSEDVVQWQNFVQGFFKKNKLVDNQEQQNFIEYLVKNSFRKGFQYIKKFCKEVVKINANTLVSSYCKFLKNIIHLIPKKSLESESWKKPIEKLCIFAYTWSVGAILTEQGRSKLDKSVSDSFSPDSLKSPITNFVINFNDRVEGDWVSWNSILPVFEFPEGNFTFSQLFIPTKENYSYSYIIDFFVAAHDPVFLYGPTGTGKTSILQQITKKQGVASLHFTFTAQTSPAIAQTQLESKLASQRKSGNIMLIPPPGKKFVYAVDDISMPKIEEYGAQPPIQMLRLILSAGGIWDRKLHIFKQIHNVEMIISGTQGRNELPPRFLRFFNTIFISELEQESITLIFSEITKGIFHRYKLKSEVMDLIDNKVIVNATLSLYQMAKIQFLPTPSKSHYLFNIRDVSKVIQGISMIKPSSLGSPDNLVKLWVHEFERVFEDRLVNEEDKRFIKQEIAKKVSVSMKSSLTQDNLFANPIVFGNFLRKGVQKKQRIYEQSKDFGKLSKTILDYMQDETNLNLILFQDIVLHICRISRCLIMEKGHILLVGLTGSGKQSSIILGAVLSQCQLMTINIRKNYGKNQFREDLFKIMKKAAVQNVDVCFMFPETHILQESFLEDINNLLSSGEVPAMFSKDNLDQIAQSTGYETFIKRVVSNLHIALTLSPIGQSFRSRIRNFPSLVNCCAIDWVSKWPQQALINVASSKLDEQKVIRNCVTAQKEIELLAEKFYMNTKKKIYITAKNYIELIETFNELLLEQKSKIETQISKLSNGVSKLQETNSLIADLKVKLTDLKPILEKKTVEQEMLLKRLEVDRIEASSAKKIVQIEERQISEKTQKALQQKKEADKILSEALPTLQAANEALNTLNRNDISEIKMNQNPHAQVKFTLECVSILLQQKQDWQTIRKIISDIGFISRLKNLDVYNISEKVQNTLKSKLKTNSNFKPNEIKQINFAAKSFCEWVLAVVNFAQVNKQIVKKKTIVKKLNDELEISNKQLSKKRQQLQQIINKLKVLQNQYMGSKQQKQKLDNDIIVTKRRLINAEELTVGLASEKIRWTEKLIEFEQEKRQLVGNVFLATCCTTLLGPYSLKFRQQFIDTIKSSLTDTQILFSDNFNLQYTLGDPLQIADWINYGLPKDSFSIDNSILIKKTNKNPLMVDPQLQASRWLKSYKKADELVNVKMNNENAIKIVENAIRMKYPLLIELVEPSFDPSLNSLLAKQFQNANNRFFVRLGESRIQIDPNIKIYLFTKLPNPSFAPQIFIKLTVINFSVTPEGLDDQLLAKVVQNQLPEIQLKKRELVNTISKGKITLQQNEDKILELLNNSKGNILDDQELIMNLKVSKKVSSQVKQSLEENVVKSKEIEKARAIYKPIAERGTQLYLVVDDIANLDQMYQFSLQYFVQIFQKVLKTTPSAQSSQQRVKSIVESLTLTIYENISRSLFNQHKRIFAFVIAIRVQQVQKKLYNYFIKGNYSLEKKLQKPTKMLYNIAEDVCVSIFNLKQIIDHDIYELLNKEKENVVNVKDNPIQELKHERFSDLQPFEKLILTRILKPEATLEAITQYIHDTLGQAFLNTDAVSMNIVYNDTTNKIPLICVLSVGADPLQSILRLAKEKGKRPEEVVTISLGQGQGPAAQKALQTGSKQGGWVVLQNCHLGKSFLTVLEKRIEQITNQKDLHENFRLYLTSMPCDYFPVTILQNSLKLTSQPPRGKKSNMKRLLQSLTWGESYQQRTFSFNLCLFHAIILQRRKFGPLGWNILYDFNQSDLTTSLTIVNNLIISFDEIPFQAIEYFVGEIVYGGRVTDEYDRRLLKTLLMDYISPQVIDNPKVDPDVIENYSHYVDNLDERDLPSIFGLNQNGQKTYLIKLARQAFDSIMLLQPQKISENNLDKTISLIQSLLHNLPAIIKKNQSKKYPDALEINLLQEATRFNKLIAYIENNFKQIISALKGQIIMTEELEKALNSISNNQVPKAWQKRAYPSMKPLASWFDDFIERVKFFKSAVNEKPRLYWISAFFFPQGFLTSILQIQARKLKIPIDSLTFQYIFKQNLFKESTDSVPAEGCLIYGLTSQACCIDLKTLVLKQSPPDVIDAQVPVIHFKPVQAKADQNNQLCEIPLYKTKLRAGTLSTTGHSTNFIISISCKSDQQEAYWIKRGAAFFCSLQK